MTVARTRILLATLVAVMAAACAEPPQPDATSDPDDDAWIAAAADDGVDPNEEPDAPVTEVEPPIDPAAELEAEIQDELAAEPVADVADDGLLADDGDGEAEEDDGEDVPAGTVELPPAIEAAIPSKIKYVLVIVKENHTFDNYFTGFPSATSSTHAVKFDTKTHERIHFLRPLAPPDELDERPGSLARRRRSPRTAMATWMASASTPARRRTSAITSSQIPDYWKYASEFVLADHLFSDVARAELARSRGVLVRPLDDDRQPEVSPARRQGLRRTAASART